MSSKKDTKKCTQDITSNVVKSVILKNDTSNEVDASQTTFLFTT